jgi:hypothetical protein
MFISILYMFRAAMRPSSGELILLIRHLVYVTLYRWPSVVQVWMRLIQTCIQMGASGSAVGWGTALQAGMSRARFPMLSLKFFYWHNSSGRTMALGLTQPLTEMGTRNISWGEGRPVRRADNLTTFMCRLSWNLGASTCWNTYGLSRPVMGLTYIYIYIATSVV